MFYVDDPFVVLWGADDQGDLFAAIMVLVWEVLGFQLAYRKDQLDKEITWAGVTFRCERLGVRAWIKEWIISDMLDDLINFPGKNIIPRLAN